MSDDPKSLTSLPEVFHPRPDTLYPLETAARLAGVERRTVLVYCRHGMIRAIHREPGDPGYFTDESVLAIRRLEQLRATHDINMAGLRIIADLLRRVDALEAELRFLRG